MADADQDHGPGQPPEFREVAGQGPNDRASGEGQGVVVLLATAPSAEGERLARGLVAARLVACVNLLPGVRSIYRWEGAVACDEEVVLLAKTTRSGFAAARDHLLAEHPYDLPEILALPVADGLAGYLSWVRGEVGGP